MKIQALKFSLIISVIFNTFSCKNDDPEPIGPIAFNQEFTINENSDKDDFVGIVGAFDNRANDKIIFSISGGNEGDVFAIDSLSGRIVVNNAAVLDYEKYKEFNLKVTSIDSNGNTDSSDVYIKINNSGKSLNGLVSWFPFANSLEDYITKKSVTGTNTAFFHDRNSWRNESLQLMGYKSYVLLDNMYDFPNRTISLWFKAISIKKPQYIYCSDNEDIQYGATTIAVVKNNACKLYFGAGDATDSVPITENIWYQTTISIKTNEASFYLNGELVSTKPIKESDNSSFGYKKAVLGADNLLSFLFFQGLIDDLLIYNRALSKEEVKMLYIEDDFTWN